MSKYFKVWLQLSKNAINGTLSNRIDSSTYLIGKLIRFIFFFVFIRALFQYTPDIAGYSRDEAILFFLTFNLVDVLAQAFFRGIYVFKGDIRRGTFDALLIKPINTLFYIQAKLTDLLDIIFLLPILYLLVQTMRHIPSWESLHLLSYLGFLFLSIILVLGIHIFTAGMTIRYTESDNIIWLYRECMTIGRFPPEIYSSLVQFIFTFLIPIIVIVSFPVKSLLGKLTLETGILASALSLLFFVFTLVFWKQSIKKYSSASS